MMVTMDMHGWPMMSACRIAGLGPIVRPMGKMDPCSYAWCSTKTPLQLCMVLHTLPGPELSGSPPPPPPPPPPTPR